MTGLPDGASWQDLKDCMRQAGDVVFAKVDQRGGGTVEYSNEADMRNAYERMNPMPIDCRRGKGELRLVMLV